MELILGAIIGPSIAANVFLVLYLRRLKKSRPLSKTAEALLHDLTAGRAVIQIECINPADIFLRSPRI